MITLRGLKEKELRELATCVVCGTKVWKNRPLAYRVVVETVVLDRAAADRQTGLAMLLGGNGRLAQVMGPDEDLAHTIDTTVNAVCFDCMMEERFAHLLWEPPTTVPEVFPIGIGCEPPVSAGEVSPSTEGA